MKPELKAEIANIDKEANVKNLKREKEQYQKSIDFHTEMLDMLANDEANIKKKYELMRKGCVKLNPDWEYEKDPEFLDCIKEDLKLQEYHAINNVDKNRDMVNKTIETQKEQLDSVTSELERLEK
jgi:hypothetical protein